MLYLSRPIFNAKRELETGLLKRRLQRLDEKNQDLLLRDHLALSKIKACYHRVLSGNSPALEFLSRKDVDNLLEMQLKPKSVFFHGPHKLHKQFILDRYPREPRE
jgi:hypothetical protein